jgi:hypothetical protein
MQRPLIRDGFRASWGKACTKADIPDNLTFTDIPGRDAPGRGWGRGPEIAAITGHSLKDVEAILDGHYLGRTIKLAARWTAAATGTDGEQKLENNQTVPDAAKDKSLKSLVGAQGLEPWTR